MSMNPLPSVNSFLPAFLSATISLVAFGSSAPSHAAPSASVRQDFPCKGCLFVPPPAGATNVPLLVVLHGDAPGGKTPLVQRDSEPFVTAAVERGFAVLAPMCPKEEGCLVGSFWQWTQGDPPGWIGKQIDAVRKDSSIDPDRIWIAGWSGGASFLGWHYARLHERYAAVLFAGGGIAPASETCAPCSPPAYFLVGDKNPLHHLAKDLKTSVLSCTKELSWDLLPGKDHAGEWRALKASGKVGEILDWLAKHPRDCPGIAVKPTADPSTAAAAPPSSASASPTVASVPAPSAPATVPKVKPEKHSGCTISSAPSTTGGAWWLVGLFVSGVSVGRRYAKLRIGFPS